MGVAKYDLAYLKSLQDNNVEESLNLEYKASGALEKNDKKTIDIAKDVSSFANSDGGIIIYGLTEDKQHAHFPGVIDPVDRTIFTKEWLETIVLTKIRPRIEDLKIHPIQVDENANVGVYIVEIPKSYTAHQAEDKRYYKRFNFSSVPMEDYEIRDVFNRTKAPIIDIEFESVAIYESGTPRYQVHVFAKNNGKVLANHINCTLLIPSNCLETADYHKGTIKPSIEELTNSLHRTESGIFFTPPLLPSRRMHLKEFFIHPFAFDAGNELSYTVYADNMEPKSSKIAIRDIAKVSRYNFYK